jgi:hypothetical protein
MSKKNNLAPIQDNKKHPMKKRMKGLFSGCLSRSKIYLKEYPHAKPMIRG